MDVYPSNTDAPRPVSCDEHSDGLLFTFEDGSTRFISNWNLRSGWPKIDKSLPPDKP
jgi:hypothetical protein